MIKKVAIYGGSFNPIHNSHIKVAEYLIKNKIVDEVWIMPCRKHSFDKSLESSKHRINMIKLAFKDKNIKICYLEIKSSGKNYTIKTARKLKQKYPHKFYFIIGSDILKDIKKWYKYSDLKNEVNFILFKRKGYIINNPGIKIEKIINYQPDGISSSQIRERIHTNKSLRGLVSREIESYIKKNRLYI